MFRLTFQSTNIENDLGFTLFELIIAPIVLGIIALILVPHFITLRADATHEIHAAKVETLKSDILLYRAHHLGNAPTAHQLAAMIGHQTSVILRNGTLYFTTADGSHYRVQTFTNPQCNHASNRSDGAHVACIR